MIHAAIPPRSFEDCVTFHGHSCPGLALGYRATLAGLEALSTHRAEDEEFLAIVENDSCAVDAVQCLAGCTYGKGNLFVRQYGKQVYTFALRGTGQAVRVALRPDGDQGRSESLSREERTQLLLTQPTEALFDVRGVDLDLPAEAEIHKSIICEECGEAAMETRIQEVGGQRLCIPCAHHSSDQPSRGRDE